MHCQGNGCHLQASWNKHGEQNFSFILLEEVQVYELTVAEIKWEKELGGDYNIRPAVDSNKGIVWTIERRARASQAQKASSKTATHLARISQANKGRKHSAASIAKTRLANIGKKRSLSTRAKIAAAAKSRVLTAEHLANRKIVSNRPEVKAKISASLTGRVLTAKHKNKISASQKGIPKGPMSVEHRAKLSVIAKGRTCSPEARVKISAALQKRLITDETRAKLSASQKGRFISEEHRAKIAASLQGKTLSFEHRMKISAAKKGKPFSPESLAKRRATYAVNRDAKQMLLQSLAPMT